MPSLEAMQASQIVSDDLKLPDVFAVLLPNFVVPSLGSHCSAADRMGECQENFIVEV